MAKIYETKDDELRDNLKKDKSVFHNLAVVKSNTGIISGLLTLMLAIEAKSSFDTSKANNHILTLSDKIAKLAPTVVTAFLTATSLFSASMFKKQENGIAETLKTLAPEEIKRLYTPKTKLHLDREVSATSDFTKKLQDERTAAQSSERTL